MVYFPWETNKKKYSIQNHSPQKTYLGTFLTNERFLQRKLQDIEKGNHIREEMMEKYSILLYRQY